MQIRRQPDRLGTANHSDEIDEPRNPPFDGACGGNIRGNIQIVRFVRIVRAPGRYGRSGAIRTDMTPRLPG
jgi:hypothetical protein